MTAPIVFVDVDSVVCEIVPPWLAAYNRDYDDALSVDTIRSYDLVDVVKPACGTKIYTDYLGAWLYDRQYERETATINGWCTCRRR